MRETRNRQSGVLAMGSASLVAVLLWMPAPVARYTLAAADFGQAPQTPDTATKAPAFEVVSIKANKSGSLRSNFEVTPGRFVATNVSVSQMLSMSYGSAGPLPAGSITGAPAWLRSNHYDIVAKAEGEPSPPEVKALVRALLADRFRLRMHRESKERPIFALTLAQKNGTLGRQLRRVDALCPGDAGAGSAPPAATANAELAPCQRRTLPGKLTGRAITMEQLAAMLVSVVDDHREVRNDTGLQGRFDIDLDWAPTAPVPSLRESNAPPLPPIDSNAPELFTAIQEQLGLKLVSEKDGVDVWVIDQVEEPMPD
jgi:uncharacterized protein (TIGR03435 family)